MIPTLLITMLVESAVVAGYSVRLNKPVRPLLFTSFFANLLTQSILWIVLNLYFRHYLLALLMAETLIWMIECLLLYLIPSNRLAFSEAALLSLGMNLASLAVGWLLPL